MDGRATALTKGAILLSEVSFLLARVNTPPLIHPGSCSQFTLHRRKFGNINNVICKLQKLTVAYYAS